MPLFGAATSTFDVQVRFGLDNAEFLRRLNATGQQMTRIGQRMTMGLTLPIVAFGVASIRAAFIFNKGMANVATLIPGNIERVNELKRSVQELSIEMGKSTTDMTDGLYQVISAFGDTADTMAVLQVNAKLAVAGLSSVTDAINLTSAVTKAYGDTSAQAMQKVADLATLVVRLGQTTFPELAGSIGMVTPMAAALDVAVEELMGVFATLTGVTGNAANVATQLRAVMNAMLTPATAMAEAIDHLEYTSSKAMIAELGLVGAMRALIATTDGSQEAIAELFPNIRALPMVFALAGGQAEVFDRKMVEMADSSDTLSEAFGEQTGGVNEVGFAYEQAKAKLEVLVQRMGDRLLPAVVKIMEAIGPLLERITGWIERFSELDVRTQRLIAGFVLFLAGVGPLVTGIGKITTAVGILAGALGAARLAAFGLWGALGLAIGAAGWGISREMRRARGRAGGIGGVELYREPWEARPTYAPGIAPPGVTGVVEAELTRRDMMNMLREGFNIALPDGGLLTLEGMSRAFEEGGTDATAALLDAALLNFGALREMDEGVDEVDEALQRLLEELEEIGERAAGGGGAGIVIDPASVVALAKATREEALQAAGKRAGAWPFTIPVAERWELLGKKGALPEDWELMQKRKEAAREEAERRLEEWKKAALAAAEQKRADIAAALQEPFNRVWRDFRKALVDDIRVLGRSVVSGDIARALANVFDTLGLAIGRHIETRIMAEVPGLGGGLLGAFGAGIVGGAISWLGGLFGGGKAIGGDISTPIFAYVTNWEEFWQFGTTLPESFVYSGRAGGYDVDPHGRTLDYTWDEYERREHLDY